MNRCRDGYIAITSAIIIAALVLTLSLTLGTGAVLTRNAILASELQELSRSLAEACVDTALLRIAQNPAYAGDETIAVASSTCRIFPVSSSSSRHAVSAQGVFQGATANVRVLVDAGTLSVISWEEPAGL